MQQLTGVDASFLYMETNRAFGHVASLCVFDQGDSEGAGYEATRKIIGERLSILTPMRRRLVEVPLNLDHPYWIEDPEFDLDFHIRETAVPPPGSDEQLANLVSRLIARPLDRSRPLWELYVIQGLPDNKIAQLTKIHHTAIDGVAGAQLLMTLLDISADPEPRDLPPLPEPEQIPRQSEMLARGLAAVATQPYRQSRLAVRTIRSLSEVIGSGALDKQISGATDRLAHALPDPLTQLLGRDPRRPEDEVPDFGSLVAPHCPWNATISPHRRFAYTTVDLEDVKKVKNALDATVNDVVLAMCAGALRDYLMGRGELPDEPLRTMIPVSVRSDDQGSEGGNRVSGMVANLHTDVVDPAKRMALIHESTVEAKELLGALPADLLTDVAEFMPPAITARAARFAARSQQAAAATSAPFNLVISNVPGPQIPLFGSGARLLHYYPVSAVTDGQGLNITVQSYDGRLDFGLVACRQLVPDLWDLTNLLPKALDELLELA